MKRISHIKKQYLPAKNKSKASSRIIVHLEKEVEKVAPVVLPEFHLKKILVPVDFSESARKALSYALSFARQFNAEIILLHVAELILPASPDLVTGVTALNIEPLENIASRRLDEWRRYIPQKIRAKAKIVTGLPSQAIVEIAAELNVDLIIVGHRGRTGLAHLLLDGTAEYVLRHAPCPALVVRASEHDFISEEEHLEFQQLRTARLS